jgi:hypothetical protein
MAFHVNMPLGSNRNLPVNWAIISNFAASGFWTALANDFRDGAGGGGETGAAARPGRRRIARTHPAAVPQARRQGLVEMQINYPAENRSRSKIEVSGSPYSQMFE